MSARIQTIEWLNARVDELERQNAELWMKYPHMCRDGHEEIGHSDSENERCPVCRLQDRVHSLEDALITIRDFPSATGELYKTTEVYRVAKQALAAKEPKV